MDITNQLQNFLSESSFRAINKIKDSIFKTEASMLTSSVISLLDSLGVIKIEFKTSNSIEKAKKFLSLLDPENYFKYSSDVFQDSMFSSSLNQERQFSNEVRYLSILPEQTFMYVTNENYITIYIWGKKSAHLSDLIHSYMTGEHEKQEIFNRLTEVAEEKFPPITVKTLYYDQEDKDLYSNSNTLVNVKPLDKIFTNNKNKELITTYINKWQKASTLFNNLDITYKLGILFYGPPGTGKTTMVKTIASMLQYDLYIVDIASFPQSPPDFSNFSNSIILFEDIDYAFSDEFNSVEDKARANALLQALDGVTSASDVIFAATTNDIDSLSDALTRDGRFDLKINMEELNDKQDAIDMCKSLNLNEEEAENIVNNIDLPINQAELQNKCIQYIFENVENWSTGEEKEEDEDIIEDDDEIIKDDEIIDNEKIINDSNEPSTTLNLKSFSFFKKK